MRLKNPDTRVKNPVKAVPMPDALYREMRGYVRAAAEPRPPGDSVKAAIGRAARETRLSVRRATTLWYGQPCTIMAVELERLRTWHAAWLTRRMAQLSHELQTLQALQADLRDRGPR